MVNNNLKYTLLLLFMLVIGTVVLTPPTTTSVFGQDSDGAEESNDRVNSSGNNSTSFSGQIANVFGAEPPNITTGNNNTTTGGPRTYQDFSRAEVIDNNRNVRNPGGFGNRNINLADEESMIRPTNIADMLTPQTVETQDYADMKKLIQASGFAIADMQPVIDYNTGAITSILIRGVEGVTAQPNMMDIKAIGEAYGYALTGPAVFIGNAWQVEFISVIGGR